MAAHQWDGYLPCPSDEELVVAAAAGDQDAWDLLVDRFAQRVWTLTRSHGLTKTSAAEVCQTVWVSLLDNLDHVADTARVGDWIARSAALESQRAVARHGARPHDDLRTNAWAVSSAPLYGVERRRHRRVCASFPATLSLPDNGGLARGEVIDLSLGGLSMSSSEPVPNATEVLVVLEADDPIIVSKGNVVSALQTWSNGRVALRLHFSDLTGSRRQALAELLDRLSA